MIKKNLYKNIFWVVIFFTTLIIPAQNNLSLKKITESNFEEFVINSDGPVFVMIFSQACFICKKLEQQLIEYVKTKKQESVFGKIDLDESEDFLQNLLRSIFEKHHYFISGFPSILIFSKGEFVASIRVNYESQEQLEKTINDYFKINPIK